MCRIVQMPLKVLMVMHAQGLTGPNKALLYLLGGFDPARVEVTVASPAGGYFARQLKAAGINYLPLEFGARQDFLTLVNLIRIIKKGRYHILHGHMGRVGPLIMLAGKLTGVPAIILTEHMDAAKHTWLKGNPLRIFFHRMFHLASNHCFDKVIAVSQSARNSYIARQGINPAKVVAIANCVAAQGENHEGNISVRGKFGFGQDDFVVAMIGRLIREKGYQDVINAAPAILARFPRVRLLVVGEGSFRGELEFLAKKNGVEKNIFFAGFRNDIEDILRQVDIVVQPSWQESSESFGLILIEAMSESKAVVASDIPSLREVVVDGENGFLYPEKNSALLAEKIIMLINDAELRKRMGEYGRKDAFERFNPSCIAKETENLYCSVLKRKGFCVKER